MITQTKVSEETVVFQYILPELLNLRFIFEMKVALEEPLVELNNLT